MECGWKCGFADMEVIDQHGLDVMQLKKEMTQKQMLIAQLNLQFPCFRHGNNNSFWPCLTIQSATSPKCFFHCWKGLHDAFGSKNEDFVQFDTS